MVSMNYNLPTFVQYKISIVFLAEESGIEKDFQSIHIVLSQIGLCLCWIMYKSVTVLLKE
jgi:hypothetical protein